MLSSQRSSRTSSSGSSVTSAKLRERQKQVELQAKVRALQEKQKLYEAKQKLEKAQTEITMKEEEIDLKTQLEISLEKTKILDEYAGSQVHSPHSSIVSQSVPVKPTDAVSTYLNPLASSFVPVAPVVKDDSKIVTPAIKNEESVETSIIRSVVQQLRKPVPDIQKFSGNPLEFQIFMRQFKTKIVDNSNSEDEMMSYLEQLTSGEAHQVVKGYTYLDARKGYQAALDELQERYGNDEVIANALIQRALGWPIVKADSCKGLDEFAIFLTECLNAVKSLIAVKVLEYPDNLRKLVMKLPYYCQERWRSVVLQRRQQNGIVLFQDLVNFVKTEAKKANDPLYGKEAMRHEDKVQQSAKKASFASKGKPKATFLTDIYQEKSSAKDDSVVLSNPSSQQKICVYCGGTSHSIDSCYKLQAKPHEDRLSFLRSKGLCFRCFTQGHRSKNCKETAVCKHCKGNHQSVLHMKKESESKSTEKKISTACTSSSCSNMEAGETECTLAIIPVKVSSKNGLRVETTLAFMDPGSTVSFCSESLLNRLGCSGKRMEVTLGTMGEPYTTVVTAVNELQVHDLNLVHTVSLPTVYSKDKMPVTSSHIPTQSDISCWEHLQDIEVLAVDAEVELLIGGNVPDAYTPFEVRTGPTGSPHGTRTRLGWIFWNVLRSPSASHDSPVFSLDSPVISERMQLFQT